MTGLGEGELFEKGGMDGREERVSKLKGARARTRRKSRVADRECRGRAGGRRLSLPIIMLSRPSPILLRGLAGAWLPRRVVGWAPAAGPSCFQSTAACERFLSTGPAPERGCRARALGTAPTHTQTGRVCAPPAGRAGGRPGLQARRRGCMLREPPRARAKTATSKGAGGPVAREARTPRTRHQGVGEEGIGWRIPGRQGGWAGWGGRHTGLTHR